MYIVIGDGGNREGLADKYLDPQPEWSAFRRAPVTHTPFDCMQRLHRRLRQNRVW